MRTKYLFIISSIIIFCNINLSAQNKKSDIETLLPENNKFTYVTRYGTQISSIQNQASGMIGISTGAYISEAFYAGFSGYANLTHTKVNAGIFGFEIEQIFYPQKVVHFGYNIFTGVGTVKDYEQKTNLFDNFLNIFGTNFYFVQPSLITEINFTNSFKLSFGVGYRFASGLDENSRHISKSHLNNKNLSNVNLFINFRILEN